MRSFDVVFSSILPGQSPIGLPHQPKVIRHRRRFRGRMPNIVFFGSARSPLRLVKRRSAAMLLARDLLKTTVFNCFCANDVEHLFLANHGASASKCYRGLYCCLLPRKIFIINSLKQVCKSSCSHFIHNTTNCKYLQACSLMKISQEMGSKLDLPTRVGLGLQIPPSRCGLNPAYRRTKRLAHSELVLLNFDSAVTNTRFARSTGFRSALSPSRPRPFFCANRVFVTI